MGCGTETSSLKQISMQDKNGLLGRELNWEHVDFSAVLTTHEAGNLQNVECTVSTDNHNFKKKNPNTVLY